MKKNIVSKKSQNKADDILKKYRLGLDLLQKPLSVYNNRSIAEVAEDNQKTINMYIDNNAVEDWQSNVVRPTTRNKLRQIATRLLANLIYPAFIAQDDDSKIDVSVAEVMDSISKWIIVNSNYEMEIIRSVMTALTDPVSYVEAGFYEVLRSVKKGDNVNKVVDELLSGFRYKSISSTKILFPNLYIDNIQEQDWIIKYTKMSKGKFMSKFGEYKNAKLVNEGKYITYDEKLQSYVYEDFEFTEPNEILVLHYYDRFSDEEHIYANGILVTDVDNAMTREDKLYPFAKFVYEEIQGMFVGMPAATTLMSDQDLIDAMWNIVFDTSILANRPPMIGYGDVSITGDIMTPGQITMMTEDSKVERLYEAGNGLQSGLAIISNIERSMEETASPARSAGVADQKEMTAVEFSGLEQNALNGIGLFAKQVNEMIRQIGLLMVGDVKQYMTLPKIKDLSSVDFNNVGFGKINSPMDIMSPTSNSFNTINFDRNLLSDNVDEEKMSNELLEKEGINSSNRIVNVNPVMFRKFKFHAYVSPEVFKKKNERLDRALKLEVYDRAVNNPVTDKEAITKELLLEPTIKKDVDKYIMKKQEAPQGQQGLPPELQQMLQQKGNPQGQQGVEGNLVKQMTGSQSLGTLLSQDAVNK